MVRSMWSGVAGMKAHQTKMDTIGNNIANVNTTGFKSSRVTFRDVYYQSMRSASAGTGNRGGINPSQIGYGATVGSVDLNMTQSIMSSTGNPLDIAIAGDGFIQVQDGDGNTYYTKAGMLDIDSYGNLVDTNGNFVLGVSGNPVGKAPGRDRIQLTIPSVDPTVASATESLNGILFTVRGSNTTSDGNVTINFTGVGDLPEERECEATITSSGINIRLNNKVEFASISDLENKVNAAILRANGGVPHPAGNILLSMDDSSKFQNLTGAEIVGATFGVTPGKVPVSAELEGFSFITTGENFGGDDAPEWNITQAPGANPDEYIYTISVTVGGKTYEAVRTSNQLKTPGSAILRETTGGIEGDEITIGYPNETTLQKLLDDAAVGTITLPAPATGDATPAQPSKDLGLGSRPFILKGGTAGGPQTVNDLTGIAIGADGVISATHANLGILELGRIDLATFANAKGLAQTGNTYYAATAASGNAQYAKPGEDGTGPIASNSLEMSNVDLSQEFSDMITTQRGFQANSRLITVSDTMLEELINLKR